jgi:hypothetical protein
MNAEGLPSTGFWTRFLRGGVILAPCERFLLTTLVRHVPADMAAALRQQWRGLNLVQRSPAWDELRFYRVVRGRVDRAELPNLPIAGGEVKLLSLALRPSPDSDLLHVNFWAVDGWFFNLNASRSLRPLRDQSEVVIGQVEHSYRSNLVRLEGA